MDCWHHGVSVLNGRLQGVEGCSLMLTLAENKLLFFSQLRDRICAEKRVKIKTPDSSEPGVFKKYLSVCDY